MHYFFFILIKPFEIIIDSHAFGINHRDLCALYPVSSDNDILQKQRTVSHPELTLTQSRNQAFPSQQTLRLPFNGYIPLSFHPTSSLPHTTTNLSSISFILAFQEYCVNRSIQYVTFCIGFFHLAQFSGYSSRLLHVSIVFSLFIIKCCSVVHGIYHRLTFLPLKDVPVLGYSK